MADPTGEKKARAKALLNQALGLGEKALGYAKENPLVAAGIGAGGLGAAYMGYRALNNSYQPQTQTQQTQVMNQVQRGQGVDPQTTPPQPQAQQYQLQRPTQAQQVDNLQRIDPQVKLKERLRLMKEQEKLQSDYDLNRVYQGALGYQGQ